MVAGYDNDGMEYSRNEYANAPIYMDGVAVGIVYFFDTVAVRDDKAFVQEYATYFFSTTNSSLNYQFDFQSSTDSAHFDEGQIIQTRLTGGNGNYMNNSDGGYVYVYVTGKMRYVTITLPSSSSSSSNTLSNGDLVTWCALLTALLGVFMGYVLYTLPARSVPLSASSSSSGDGALSGQNKL